MSDRNAAVHSNHWQTFRSVLFAQRSKLSSFADVRQETHEAGAFDSERHGMLAGGGATAFAAADNFALAIGELIEKFQILVIDKQRARALAVDEDGILLLGADLGLSPLPHGHFFLIAKRSETRHGNFWIIKGWKPNHLTY